MVYIKNWHCRPPAVILPFVALENQTVDPWVISTFAE